MARWMVLYADDNGEGKCAIVDDRENCNMPFGPTAEDVLDNLPGYNSGGTTFIVELPNEGEPTVYSNDQELGRHFVDL